MTGVLHEIAAADIGHPQPRISSHFSPQRAIYAAGWDVPLSTESVIAALGRAQGRRQRPRRGAAGHDERHTAGPTRADARSTPSAASTTAAIPSRSHCDWSVRHWSSVTPRTPAGGSPNSNPSIPADWRLTWYRGQCALLEGDFDAAAAYFDAVLTMLPGELDPKLALAATAELRGAYDEAARYYETVWRTNHSFYSAAFGLARQRARAGDRAGAIATLDQITAASAHFTAAGTTAIEILLDGRTADDVDEPTLLDAGSRASALTLESATKRATIRLKVLGAALDWLRAGNTPKAAAVSRRGLRPSRHPHRDGTAATARWRTRRPTCGSVSLWWRRQMRSGRGPDYERSGGEVYAVRRDCRARRAVLRELRHRAVRSSPRRHSRADDSTGELPCCRLRRTRHTSTTTAPSAASDAPSPIRDQAELDGIVLITDRGLEHPRNEDAAAAGIVAGGPGGQRHAIAAAVCDGVSTLPLRDAAAVAASIAGVDAMLACACRVA